MSKDISGYIDRRIFIVPQTCQFVRYTAGVEVEFTNTIGTLRVLTVCFSLAFLHAVSTI